ncbi:MAG: hypothetical protein Q4A76_05280, partial [Porphyromonadaceae bacterium]|nr:hypothetical protein [Porphyromonadaceae bacterium]
SSGVHSHSVTIGKAGGHSHTQHNDTWMNDQYAWDGRVPSSSGFYAGAGKKTYYTGSAGEHIHNVTINSGGAHQHSLTISGAGDHTHQINVASAGTGNSGNLQPYITVYRWIRTA